MINPSTTPMDERDDWRTPPDVFEKLNLKFRFTLDGACTAANALLPRFSTKENPVPWAGERVFINPPYSRGKINVFCAKALFFTQDHPGTLVVGLLPARVGTKWFHENITLCRNCRWEPWPRRIQFMRPDGTPSHSNREDSVIAVWGDCNFSA